MLRRSAKAVVCVLMMMWSGAAAEAQQRPLVTEDPETIGAGRILIEAGFDHQREQTFPVSGLKGNLLSVPLIGVSIGVGSIAEIQVDTGFHTRLNIESRQTAPLSDLVDVTGTTTTDVDDIVIGTKVRLAPEAPGRPAFGLRFATRLPRAGNDSGLGVGTTDFVSSFLIGKTVESVRVVGNVGLGILGDPLQGNRQNKILAYGISFARAVTTGLEVVGEFNGKADASGDDVPPAGAENRAMMRLGTRYTHGANRVDAALLVGMTSRDPSLGITAGYTYVFNAFRVP